MTKFPAKVLVWLAACSKGSTALHIVRAKTLTHNTYIRRCLPLALALGRRHFGRRWWFQQDNASPHTQHASQDWCRRRMPHYFDKRRWPPNSPDLNPCDYSLSEELGTKMN